MRIPNWRGRLPVAVRPGPSVARWGVRWLVLTWASCLGFVACGPDRAPPAVVGGEGGDGGARVPLATGGAPGTGGAAGAPGGALGSAGEAVAGLSATAGAAGSAGVPAVAGTTSTGGTVTNECGNGSIDDGEECDGDLLGESTCAALGFDTGELACVDCAIDVSDCGGTEDCFDARDNDGDGDLDCDDADCSAACGSLCDFAPTLADPSSVTGDTAGHTSVVGSSCSGGDGAGGAGAGPSGPEVAYRFVPAQTGVLEVSLTSAEAELAISVRGDCESGPELACAWGATVSTAVVQGEAVYILVDGVTGDDSGTFELSAQTRAVVCGDGVIDPGEECDDGGNVPGGGCDEACLVESSETNQQGNDTPAQADDYVDPFYGRITIDDPVDVIQINVPDGSTLRARTLDLGNDACANGELDSMLELLVGNGNAVLAFNDDFGGTLCSEVVGENLAAGSYYLRVTAAGLGNTPEFPYRLEIILE